MENGIDLAFSEWDEGRQPNPLVVSFINIVFTYFICTHLYINAYFLYSMVIICFYFINVEFALTTSVFLSCLEETEKLAKESKKKRVKYFARCLDSDKKWYVMCYSVPNIICKFIMFDENVFFTTGRCHISTI